MDKLDYDIETGVWYVSISNGAYNHTKFKTRIFAIIGDENENIYDSSKFRVILDKKFNANHCICGHDIVNSYTVEHIKTGKKFIFGSQCVKKYLPRADYAKIQDKIECDKCKKLFKPHYHCNICNIKIYNDNHICAKFRRLKK